MLTSYSSTFSTTFWVKVNRKFLRSSLNSQSQRNITRKCGKFLELRPGSTNAQKLNVDQLVLPSMFEGRRFLTALQTNKSKLFKYLISLVLLFCLFTQSRYAIVAQEASMKFFQITLSWANLVALSQPTPALFISFSGVLFHVVRGRPLFLRPSGNHVSAVLACAVGSIWLSTWPRHFLSCGLQYSGNEDFVRSKHSRDLLRQLVSERQQVYSHPPALCSVQIEVV